MKIIIDGYNVLFSVAALDPALKLMPDSRLYVERDNFLKVLARKIRTDDYPVIIIFDGREKTLRADWIGKLLVIYTTKQESADDLICRLAIDKEVIISVRSHLFKFALSSPILVVTDDEALKRKLRELSSAIITKKAEWLSLN